MHWHFFPCAFLRNLHVSQHSEQLFANLVLTRAIPDKANLRKVQVALHSETASKLAKYYADRVDDFMYSNQKGISSLKVASLYRHHAFALDQLRRAVDQLCDGVESAERPIEKYDGYVDADFAPEIQRHVEEEARK